MKNKFNSLRKYLYENSVKEYRRKTVNGLFCAILEPVISNTKFESCVLLRIFDDDEKISVLKRLNFTDTPVFSYNDFLAGYNLVNNSREDIWDKTQFLTVLGQRYSASLIWDYSDSETKDGSNIYLVYNSKIVGDIAKLICDNSVLDISDYIKKYSPDRRENSILNGSINKIVSLLNDVNEEISFSEAEKNSLIHTDNTLETAHIVAEKAKFTAHEIKNNLSIINLYEKIAEKRLESINIDAQISESLNNALKNIKTASSNISDLIGDLRCMAAPYITEVNLKEQILNTASLCKEKAAVNKINIEVKDFNPIVINTDKTKFQCALMNLIYNAAEACNEGGIIVIDCKSEDNKVKVYVKNNGEPIKEEFKQKIFEPDFTTKEKGSGIGLAVCMSQLALVGGQINLLNSDINETVFEIVLPLK